MNVLGAALLHAGLSEDIEELNRQCLVVKLSKTNLTSGSLLGPLCQ